MTRFPHVLIRASAGTGKTYQLSNRYLGLLLSGAAPEQILATTFTRKAAGEILDRILLRLAQAATQKKALRELAEALGEPDLDRDRCLETLRQLAQNLHRVQICTLDSFFAQLAGAFCLELGLPVGWRISEPLEEERLRTAALDAILAGDARQEVSRLMNLMTKGEAERSVTDLLRGTVNDLYGLYQETAPQAWRQFPQSRPLSPRQLRNVLDELAGATLPEGSRLAAARDGDLDLAAKGQWEEFIGKGLAAKVAAGETTYQRAAIPADAVLLYERLLGHARAVMLEQVQHQTEATHDLLTQFDAEFQRRKRDSRALRFDDVTRCLAQASHVGQLERLEFRLDTQLAHLLLDEFQDTSPAQWRVLHPFAQRVTAANSAGTPGSFFCVGDVKQAIYGWRGGRAEIFDALEKHLPGLQREYLNQSYRSAPPVIDTVNRVFDRLTSHPNLERTLSAVERWCGQFDEHTTALTKWSGYVRLETAQAGEDEGPLVLAAERIAELVAKAPQGSVGVLTRRNETVARLIYELRRRNVAASEEGGNPLTDSAAVLAVLALLRLADHPGDTVARCHVAGSPVGRVVGFDQWDNDSLADQLAASVRRTLLERGYGEALRGWVGQLADASLPRDDSRLRQLVELGYGYDEFSSLRASDFVRFVEQQRVADANAANVRVMTIHQAKGLQFDVVVLPELGARIPGQSKTYVVHQPDPTEAADRVCMHRNADIQALLPDDMQEMFAQATEQEVMECLCVLYVALTRAIHALHLIIAPSAASEKRLPRTFAGLLRAALTEGQPLAGGCVAYECGDPRWWAGKPAAAPPSLAPVALPTITFGTPPRPALVRTAPSRLEGGGKFALRDALRLDNVAALARGTLIHAWFEQIAWLEDGVPPDMELRSLAARLATGGLNVDDLIGQFRQMLAQPAIARYLRRDTYRELFRKSQPWSRAGSAIELEVCTERSVAVQEGQQLVIGAIDRLVLARVEGQVVAAEVIDFKTDTLDPGDPAAVAAKVDYYRPQQEAYRRAVAKMFRLEERAVSLRLLFVGAGLDAVLS